MFKDNLCYILLAPVGKMSGKKLLRTEGDDSLKKVLVTEIRQVSSEISLRQKVNMSHCQELQPTVRRWETGKNGVSVIALYLMRQ